MRSRLALSLSLLALASQAGAQAVQPPRDSAARRIEPMTVRGARAPSVTGGATVVTIRPDSLPVPLAPAPHIGDVLRQTAFVLVRQNSRGEMEIGVRGSDSRQAAVMLDGLPLTVGWDARTDPSLIPTTGVEQIVVVRGLATLLGGANTLGGVIRMDLNGPLARNAKSAPSLQLGTGFDQYASRILSVNGAVPLSVRGGTLRVRGGITSRAREGVALPSRALGDVVTGGTADPGDPANRALRTNTDARQVDGFTALRYDHRRGAFVGLTATGYDTERGVAPEQHLASPRFWRYPSQQRTLAILSGGTGLQQTPMGYGSLSVSAGRSNQRLDIENFSSRTYTTLASRELGREASTVYRIEGTHSLPRNAQFRLAGTVTNVVYDETLNAQRSTASASRYEQQLSSVGAELDVPIVERLLVSGGVVQDESRTPQTGGRPALGTLARAGWRVGSTLRLTDGVRLHASGSRRARFAALRELYSGALDRFDPNPLLRPETLLGIESGITLSGGAFADRGLQLQAVGFVHRLDDAVVRITLPNRLFRRINRDQIRSEGIELLASYAPAALKGATISADATLQHIRVIDQTITGNANNERRAEHNPERRASFAVTSPAWRGVRTSLMARHIGAQYCQHPDLGRQVELGAQTISDAAVTRTFAIRSRGLLQRLTAIIAVDNIGDRAAYDQCGLPQAGRTVRFGVTIG
ncbi:TonB-dependent receptor plug domain-containing protein [Gemmatimonas sp.]|uniref:TonB-dependent receptor plug domain-containing protein n=1 Tax=Gemmatimonas sp. TaxID=1962908 RepID=UPI00391DB645